MCVCVCTVVGIVVDCVFCLVALKSTTHNSVINTQSCTCLARIIAVQIILGVKYFSGLFECIPCTNRHTCIHSYMHILYIQGPYLRLDMKHVKKYVYKLQCCILKLHYLNCNPWHEGCSHQMHFPDPIGFFVHAVRLFSALTVIRCNHQRQVTRYRRIFGIHG